MRGIEERTINCKNAVDGFLWRGDYQYGRDDRLVLPRQRLFWSVLE
jgi:hypothetical protein